jgi:hypothetical protein
VVRWEKHPETQATRDTKKHIKSAMPVSFILENVLGFGDASEDGGASPLDLMLADMRDLGYHVRAFQLDLSTWIAVNRTRCPRLQHNESQARAFVFSGCRNAFECVVDVT